MLNSFKENLKKMAVDPKDPFHRHIRKRVGKRATSVLEKRLKQLIFLMPGLVSRTHELWAMNPGVLEIKRTGGFLLTYMYHPKDFLPEEEHGFFGYLDDAYLAALIYKEVLFELKQRGGRLSLKDEKFLEDIEGFKKAARIVIPEEAKKIEAMVVRVKKGDEAAYLEIFDKDYAA